MVVSVGKATSADYYTGGGGVAENAESYYLDAVTGGEPAGQWSGAGAERLGLTGEVDAQVMHTVYGDFINPLTGEQIGRKPDQHKSVEERITAALAAEPGALPERVEEIRTRIERSDRQSVIGWDATFSVAKSVTVAHTAVHRAELAAIRSGDTDRAIEFESIRSGIESAIHEANRAMLDYAATITTVRTGGSAGTPTQWAAAPGLVIASFFQHTSRNIDPQLHIHNVILNRAFAEDGKARALDGQDLLAQKHALGAIADRVLEELLTRMGFEFQLRPDGMARELTVIPLEANNLFSSRARQVSDRVAELLPDAEEKAGRELTDLELFRLKQYATLNTRPTKGSHIPETREELIERWWATTTSIGSDLDSIADGVREHLHNRGVNPSDFEWSPSTVVAEAVAAVGERRSVWRHSDLMLEISRRLPSLGGLDPESTIEVLQRLTDAAVAGSLVQQVSGHTIDATADADLIADLRGDSPNPDRGNAPPPGQPGRQVTDALAADPFTAPSSHLYATRDTLMAEEALRRAGITRGAHHVDATEVGAWLDQNTPTIGADQRTAVTGIASSDAELCVLVGPAGTGKSYTAGAFAGAWADLTTDHPGGPGRVTGLAVSQIATEVLIDDGVAHSRNIEQWLATQQRIADGSIHPADTAWRLRPADVVMVDEASMVATADLDRIHALAQDARARIVLTGDPRQLGAVEAGGVMGLLDGHAETYTLSDVRRFTTEWEPAASLALRDGDQGALTEYDRHGRLIGHATTADAAEAAARAAVADRLDGRSVVVVTGTNEQAAAIATRVRDQLIELGLTEPDGVLLGRDGCTAGVGDIIAARRNEHTLGVTNRAQYRVTAVGEDGSLTVVPVDRSAPAGPDAAADDGDAIVLPASYVDADVQLGYASTAHAAQGLTVDSAHLVTDGDLDASGLYVGMTRGRNRNTAHVSLDSSPGKVSAPAASAPGGEVLIEADLSRSSARAVLEGCLERDTSSRAATVEAELDTERLSSMRVLAGRHETVVRAACRERMDRHLDRFAAEGILDGETRARLGADQGADHLSRLLRAVEQSGADPAETLRTAITTRSLGDADSPAQVLSHRITGGHPLSQPAADVSRTPDDVAPQAVHHLGLLDARMSQREQALGDRAAEEPPAWALSALGPVPADPLRREEWASRAGTVAAHREATGWDHPDQAIGTMPGLSSTERRASYAAAWVALGQPETGLDETAMTEGQLRTRVRAAQSELDWAPPHADAALRAAERAAETARQSAAIERARAEHAADSGDEEAAQKHAAEAEAHEQLAALKAAAIEPLTKAATARSTWAASTAVTLDQGDRSTAELERRGVVIGQEPDRTQTEDWLTHERQAQQAEDADRPVTEADLYEADDSDSDVAQQPGADLDLPEPVTGADSDVPAAVTDRREPSVDGRGWGRSPSPAHRVLAEDATAEEIETAAATAAFALAKAQDRASQDTAHLDPEDLDDSAHVESDEAGRRRRDAADHQVAAHEATDDHGLDVSVHDA